MIDYRPKYVSFDCYGTLINYQIDAATRTVVRGQIDEADWPAFRESFSKYRYDQVLGSYYPYRQVLQDAYDRTCRTWGIESDESAGEQFGEAVLSWGPHDNVVAPLTKMAERYQLVILSNADTAFLDVSVPKLEAPFHAVFTAEQAGVYKPRYQAFEYMVEQLNARPEDFLHVSSHTRYDIMPMHDLGFRNLVMLRRGYDPAAHSYGYVDVDSLDELNQMLGID
ncbi:haloacid dehalogenase type II [Rudaeicoccus suwonensis]|uniref:2-haloacid dehalogenase n=1 Tax=Rudaeicoccus suwonensis TaxID=657409 RepID=A0A561E3T5_9MICO|nr:haloacid dehalogenase type II [Rudaeicoccus suwonensis]TWE10259.1 2-haloacid dehalogenase [Rudaeicoccus suwonensis]